jgi:hypothetical protein
MARSLLLLLVTVDAASGRVSGARCRGIAAALAGAALRAAACCVLAGALVATLPAQTVRPQRAEPDRTTLVRTVNAAGEPLAGAKVVFCSVALAGWPMARSRMLELVTDAEGKARANLDETLVWAAWALHDHEKTRLASDVLQPVTCGRPMRLELRPFPVPDVRIRGLEPWRKRFGDKLELAFASAATPFATFRLPLPAGDEPVLRLPPLPRANFFPCLVLPDGGLLDARYFSPHFLDESEQPPEELYERAYPLKRVILAEPAPTRWTIVDPAGKPVAGARVFLRPEYSELLAERRLTSDEQGQVEIVLPHREEGQRGWFTQRVLVLAPGFLPAVRTLMQPLAAEAAVTVNLMPGPALDWKLAGELPAAASLYLLTRFVGETGPDVPGVSGDFVDHWVRVEVGAEGKLELPAAASAPAGNAPPPYELWLVDGKAATLLATGPPAVARTVDVAKLVAVTAHVRVGDRSVQGGTLYLCRRENDVAVDTVGYGLDREGAARLRLPPGRHLLLAVHESRGAGLLLADVPDQPSCELSLNLQPHANVAIEVRDAAGAPVAGAMVGWQIAYEGIGYVVLPAVFGRFLSSDQRTDASGRLQIQLPSLAGRGDVHAQLASDDGSVLFGRATVEPAKDTKVEITLGQ